MIDNQIDKIYYPCCREMGCGGILKISFNSNNSTISYECEKNEKHKGEKIYYETFEKYYLKEKKILVCMKCKSILENECIFKCKKCDNVYCASCFLCDEHIKKDITNLINLNIKKCINHKKDLLKYCVNCKKYFCFLCLISDEEHNNEGNVNHNLKSLVDFIPSINKINNIREKIKSKAETYEKLIKSIDEWKNKLLKCLERIKNNLKKEVVILEKLFKNFTPHFVNYSYYINFFNLDKNIKDINNQYLHKFFNSYSFKEQSKIMIDFLFFNKDKYILKRGYLTKLDKKNLYLKLIIILFLHLIIYSSNLFKLL